MTHVVSGHIDVHSDTKRFDSITYAETPNFDKIVKYSLGVFSKNGLENSNCSYFANTCVYMQCSCIAKMNVKACLVFLKIEV